MCAGQLKDLYLQELKSLWSTSDQMHDIVAVMATKAYDHRLAADLRYSVVEIEKNTGRLQRLLSFAGIYDEPPRSRSMEGLVQSAVERVVTNAPDAPELVDLEILCQFLRLSHFALADFDTAAAYAKALGRQNDHVVLRSIVTEIQRAEARSDPLEERAENAAALAEAEALSD